MSNDLTTTTTTIGPMPMDTGELFSRLCDAGLLCLKLIFSALAFMEDTAPTLGLVCSTTSSFC